MCLHYYLLVSMAGTRVCAQVVLHDHGDGAQAKDKSEVDATMATSTAMHSRGTVVLAYTTSLTCKNLGVHQSNFKFRCKLLISTYQLL